MAFIITHTQPSGSYDTEHETEQEAIDWLVEEWHDARVDAEDLRHDVPEPGVETWAHVDYPDINWTLREVG